MSPELPRIAVRLDQELDPHRCIELAVVAETSGYSSLWFAENPLHRAILPAVSACALQTERGSEELNQSVCEHCVAGTVADEDPWS